MFTVMIRNHALRSGQYRGTFDTVDAADQYARDQAARSRAFCEFQAWEGTPRNPLRAVGAIHRGVC